MFCLLPDFKGCKLKTIGFPFLQLPRHFQKCLGISGNARFLQMPATYAQKSFLNIFNATILG